MSFCFYSPQYSPPCRTIHPNLPSVAGIGTAAEAARWVAAEEMGLAAARSRRWRDGCTNGPTIWRGIRRDGLSFPVGHCPITGTLELYVWVDNYERKWLIHVCLFILRRSQQEMSHTCRGSISLHGALIYTEDTCNLVVSNGGTQTVKIYTIYWFLWFSLTKSSSLYTFIVLLNFSFTFVPPLK